MRYLIAVAIAFICSFSSADTVKTPPNRGQGRVLLEIKGLTPGMTFNELEKRFPSLCSRGEKIGHISSCTYHNDAYVPELRTIAEQDVQFWMFFFLDDKLGSISFSFMEEPAYEPIKNAMLIKFGTPTKRETSKISNRFGAIFSQEKLIWLGHKITLQLDRYSFDLKHSIVTISSDEFDAEQRRLEARDAIRKSGDL